MKNKQLTILFASMLPLLVVLVLTSALGTAVAQTSPTATITVDTLADENDGCAVGGCSLRDAINDADPGDTINFSVSGTIVISGNGELVISKSLTISSSLPITISGNNATRVFNIFAGNVIFDGLTISNGNAPNTICGNYINRCGGGIMIQNNSVAETVTNSTLISNSAGYGGGGIFNYEGTVMVNNSTLTGNLAHDGPIGDGGGIFNWAGTLAVTNSTLSNNSANDGGGISSVWGTSTVNNSTLISNSAGYSGGGIYNNSTLIVTDSTLSKNSAIEGGAIFNSIEGDLEINNSSLISNSVFHIGGGISNWHGTLTANNSIFSSNLANDKGGGIYNSLGTLTITNSSLLQNSTDLTVGGGVVNEQGSMTVNYSTISGNSANTSGGGIFNNDGYLKINNSDFSNNSAPTGGGGVYNNEGFLDINNSMFASNDSTGFTGGGIFNVQGVLSVSSSTLSGNSAPTGGGIANWDGSTATIDKSTLFDNSAVVGGGIYNYGGTLMLNNSTLSDNVATDYGGGIGNSGNHLNLDGSLNINNSTITNNRAGIAGGGISSRGTVTTSSLITNTLVSGNILSGTTIFDDLALYDGGVDSFVSGGYNLIGAIGENINAFAGPGDQISITNPLLGPLADNGGKTQTHALLPGSPAIDTGNDATCLPTDQRGITRPQGPTCDIGSFEKESANELTVEIFGSGSGVVSSEPAGIDCGSDCSEVFDYGMVVTLTAVPNPNSSFTGWAGACTGSDQCVLTMTAVTQVTATFTLDSHELTASQNGNGGGSVTSTPPGIDCGSDCSETFDYGTVVTLTAVADQNQPFPDGAGHAVALKSVSSPWSPPEMSPLLSPRIHQRYSLSICRLLLSLALLKCPLFLQTHLFINQLVSLGFCHGKHKNDLQMGKAIQFYQPLHSRDN